MVITGPATWLGTGGKRLAIGAGNDYPVLQCRGLDEDLAIACDAKSLAGDSRLIAQPTATRMLMIAISIADAPTAMPSIHRR